MVKKIGLLIVFLVFGVFLYIRFFSNNNPSKTSVSTSISPTKVQEIKPAKKESSVIFVPYWTVGNFSNLNEYDSLIYFGIAADTDGIIRNEAGYENIDQFMALGSSDQKKFLAVRMIDAALNSKILNNKEIGEKIIDDSIEIAKEKYFDGIVLDFEMNALGFDSVIQGISRFYEQFSKKTKDAKLDFWITLYGDTFYRGRPYDVKRIALVSDEILIMAYDFHKSRGNPGPNFPMEGKNRYGYDFETMITDFLSVVKKDKLTVVFGMYGYNWTIDAKNQSIESAKALSLNEIQQKFLTDCEYKECKTRRDDNSKELYVTYQDEQSQNHIVWFEDEKSIEEKKKYLKTIGIERVGYWAYSYF